MWRVVSYWKLQWAVSISSSWSQQTDLSIAFYIDSNIWNVFYAILESENARGRHFNWVRGTNTVNMTAMVPVAVLQTLRYNEGGSFLLCASVEQSLIQQYKRNHSGRLTSLAGYWFGHFFCTLRISLLSIPFEMQQGESKQQSDGICYQYSNRKLKVKRVVRTDIL